MSLRTLARILIAISFSISGLVETLGATGLVVELSPDGRWGSGIHTLAVSGPLQLVGAAVLASGRKTRWALIILGGYVFLSGVLGNLPLIFNPNVGGNALTGLLGNLAVMGGIVYWFSCERPQGDRRERLLASMAIPGRASLVKLVLCLAVMAGVLYWLRMERLPGAQTAEPTVPITHPAPALPVRWLA
jgi:uncharacterized membrane protein YphA (DoxX/SURF4 family)